MLEHTRRSWEAREVLAGFVPEGAAGGGAARHHFTRRPEEALALLLAELDRVAASRLPALAGALEKTSP